MHRRHYGFCDDNCLSVENPEQADTDNDGIGDACDESTIIILSSFAAIPKAGKIILEWSTESEMNPSEFNIYRSESETGEYVKINQALIPAQGSLTQGATYEFVDKDVKLWKTYYYKLGDIDFNGSMTMHGPVIAEVKLFK